MKKWLISYTVRRTQEAENSKEYAGYLMAFNSFLVEVQTAQTVMEAEK